MRRIIFLLLTISLLTAAQTSQITHFQNGTTLTADQLNTEFSNIYSTINNLDDANLISNASIDPLKINPVIDGLGLSRQGNGSLNVGVDGVTVKIVSDQLVVSDLPASALVADSIDSNLITDHTITKVDLEVKTPAITAALGHVALSNGTGSAVLSFVAGQSGDLANNLVNLTTGGAPVSIKLVPAKDTAISYIECTGAGGNFCEIELLRNGVTVNKIQFFATGTTYRLPPASFSFFDTPVAGTYEYKIKYSVPSAVLKILNVRLMAVEL